MPSGRFAPSPSADLHVGNLRTALLAWLFARRDHSPFFMRVEDLTTTTNPRSAEIASKQLRDLAMLGLDWDDPVVFQSDRIGRYTEVIQSLVRSDLVYPCFCTKAEIRREVEASGAAPHGDSGFVGYPGTCARLDSVARIRLEGTREPALRIRAGSKQVSFEDTLLGRASDVVDDFVVRRADGLVAYNLAVVVDDADMGVEQVVRGDDLLSTTHRQAFVYSLLGSPQPLWTHVPLVVNGRGERLAKRDGAVTLEDLAHTGVSAEAVRVRLMESIGMHGDTGLSHPERFDPTNLPKDPWVFGL